MKSLSVFPILTVLVLGGCGSDSGTNAPPAGAPQAMGATVPARSADLPSGLVSSAPVSTEGAVSLNQDCNVEGIDGKLFTTDIFSMTRRGTHEISGWVVDAKHHVIPKDLQLVVAGVGATTGAWTSHSPVWIDRKGVAETRGYGAELNSSGFAFKVDTSAVPLGSYHVYVISSGTNGAVMCDPGRLVTLTE